MLIFIPSFIYTFFMLLALRKFNIEQRVRINILLLDMQDILWDPLFNLHIRTCQRYLRSLYFLGLSLLVPDFFLSSVWPHFNEKSGALALVHALVQEETLCLVTTLGIFLLLRPRNN